MSDYRIYEARAAIAELPGKTHRPWKDGDAREHCSHCRLCGECYPTRVVIEHEKECTDALLSALQALSWYRSRSQVPADQPAPTETQTGVCPNCGYGPVIALPAPTETGPKHCPRCEEPCPTACDGEGCPMAETVPQGAPTRRST